MRLCLPATLMSLCLMPLGLTLAGGAPAAAAAGTVGPTPPSAAPGLPDADADAAKHAKRTACLQQAKAKKLVGSQRNAFIKECLVSH